MLRRQGTVLCLLFLPPKSAVQDTFQPVVYLSLEDSTWRILRELSALNTCDLLLKGNTLYEFKILCQSHLISNIKPILIRFLKLLQVAWIRKHQLYSGDECLHI